MSHRTIFALFAIVVAGAITAGCAGPSREVVQRNRVAEVIKDPARFLHKGMTADQVRAVLNEPDEVRPVPSSNGRAEAWLYRTRIPKGSDLVPGKTESRPYFDPFTGMTRDIQEPVYTHETVTQLEQLNLLMFGGRLEHWVVTRDVERSLQ